MKKITTRHVFALVVPGLVRTTFALGLIASTLPVGADLPPIRSGYVRAVEFASDPDNFYTLTGLALALSRPSPGYTETFYTYISGSPGDYSGNEFAQRRAMSAARANFRSRFEDRSGDARLPGILVEYTASLGAYDFEASAFPVLAPQTEVGMKQVSLVFPREAGRPAGVAAPAGQALFGHFGGNGYLTTRGRAIVLEPRLGDKPYWVYSLKMKDAEAEELIGQMDREKKPHAVVVRVYLRVNTASVMSDGSDKIGNLILYPTASEIYSPLEGNRRLSLVEEPTVTIPERGKSLAALITAASPHDPAPPAVNRPLANPRDTGSTLPTKTGAYIQIQGSWVSLPRNNPRLIGKPAQALLQLIGGGKSGGEAKIGDLVFDGHDAIPATAGPVRIVYVGELAPMPADLKQYPPAEIAPTSYGATGERRAAMYKISAKNFGFGNSRIAATYSVDRPGVSYLLLDQRTPGTYAAVFGNESFEFQITL